VRCLSHCCRSHLRYILSLSFDVRLVLFLRRIIIIVCRLLLSCTSLNECFSFVVGHFVLLSPSSALLSQTTEKLPLFLRGGAGKSLGFDRITHVPTRPSHGLKRQVIHIYAVQCTSLSRATRCRYAHESCFRDIGLNVAVVGCLSERQQMEATILYYYPLTQQL
jgi:hypothetical protein